MIQVQLVRMHGQKLATGDTCPRCREPIVPPEACFVAVRLPDREPIRFHVECYEVFATGLATFRAEVLPVALRERIQ